MSTYGRYAAVALILVLTCNAIPVSKGCGPTFIEPIFVFKYSPDLPFSDFAAGKIGILQPKLGRKTLFIAYRYLNKHSFTAPEQEALVEALRGKAPEDDGTEAVKTWIATRKEILGYEEKPPEIYTERELEGGYEFFPNCTKNAFEVATATLKQRISSYGVDDRNVRS